MKFAYFKIITTRILTFMERLSSSVHFKCAFSLVFAFIIGANIYHRSDLPPYGIPINELSDNYWGVIIDIAHRWRNFNFELWSRELGGGLNIFASGQYPILNPTNALAWILNDDQFYLIKLIEPYVIGIFFMTILLWDVFKTRWYIACFGGFAYMGLPFAKNTTMAESPYFLYGCGLFPAMIFVAIKLFYLSKKYRYAPAIGVGAVLALQFIGEGVCQLPQMITWWVIFFTLYSIAKIIESPKSPIESNHKVSGFLISREWLIAILIFLGAFVGLCAVQIFPSLHFFLYESNRVPEYYAINNFSIFHDPNNFSLEYVVSGCLLRSDPIRTKAFLVLLLTCTAIAITHFKNIFKNVPHKKFFCLFWITSIIYFITPQTCSLIAQWFPILKNMFRPLTQFTFCYGLHTLDFCIILSICLILNNCDVVLLQGKGFRKFLSWLFLICLIFISLLPLLIFFFSHMDNFTLAPQWLKFFTPNTQKNAIKVTINSLAILSVLSFRVNRKIRQLTLMYVLLAIGFMMTLDCFKTYDKGCQTNIDQFQITSPEHQYYRFASGKYCLPYHRNQPLWILHNYNLLYGVHGTAGFMGVAPNRLIQFAFYYNNRFTADIKNIPLPKGESKFIGIEEDIPSSFTTYFPVDFTISQKQHSTAWDGFKKIVNGEKFNVYHRVGPTPRVYFANQLTVLPLHELVKYFAKPRTAEVFLSKDDSLKLHISNTTLPGNPALAEYHNFKQTSDHKISFEVKSNKSLFVIVPERYESGWRLLLNKQRALLFPANYLFLGFKIPAGKHLVELTYCPPWFWFGLIIHIATLFLIAIYLILSSRSKDQ